MTKTKYCCLEDDVICSNCGECMRCDINPEKICDNCGQCIDSDADYKSIEINKIEMDEEALADSIIQAMEEQIPDK